MSLNCTKCGDLKKGSYQKDYWCGKCTAEQRKERRARKREEAGLRPWGSGRDPLCGQCRAVKEESYKNGSLCRQCKLDYAKDAYEKKKLQNPVGRSPNGQGPTLICKCGKPKTSIANGYCKECRSEIKRKWKAEKELDPAFKAIRNAKERERYANSLELRMKREVRRSTHHAINKGLLIKEPCEVCGTEDNVEAHHDDYMRPLDVRWLCKVHHAEHHRMKD